MVGRNVSFLIILLVVGTGGIARGQQGQSDLARAFEFERRAQYRRAADQYREALARNPTNLSALLGLERVLEPVAEVGSILPLLDSALVLQPNNRSLRALQLRVWGALGRPDSLTNAARRWIDAMPGSPEPYGEWARAASKMGDAGMAQQILAEGIQQLGDAALSQDLAELSVLSGEWVAAARQWRDAVGATPPLATAAAASLGGAPPAVRQRVVDALLADLRDPVGSRLAADLLVGWDRPLEGWTVLDRALPQERQAAVAVLRRFADRARLRRDADGARARGYALERLAQFSSGAAAERARVEAARAFVDAGERRSAERMLEQIANGSRSERSAAAAVSTLISVMAESGRVDEAEERFRNWSDQLPPDDRGRLREQIAWGWLRKGKLDRAERLLVSDSSVATLAVRGWVALYRGNLKEATEYFRSAGPRAGTRVEATERTTIMALVQRVESDSVPALGEALLRLARGDTARAVGELEDFGRGLPPDGGQSDVLGFAGRLAVDRGDDKAAEQLLVAAIEVDPEGVAAPAAHYQLARAYESMNRPEQAREELEHLILTYPESAMLPLARHFLDRLRGAVPR